MTGADKHTPMGNDQQLSHRWAILEHTSAWIQSADNKATALLAISGIIISFLLSSLSALLTANQDFSVFTAFGWSAIFLVFGIVTLLISVYHTLLCLIARTGLKNVLTPHIEPNVYRSKESLVYFGTIALLSPGTYKEMFNDAELPFVLDDLAMQIHTLSRIATEKYKELQRAYICLALSMCFLLVFGAIFVV